MGWPEPKMLKDGTVRYIARYRDLRGRKRSAGVFSDHKKAEKAWLKREAELGTNKATDTKRGRQKLLRYVEDEWFPNHVLELTSRENYRYTLDRYVLPEFGSVRMIDIMPAHMRSWITRLQASGVNPPTIEKCKVVADAIFTTALNDGITFLHAGRGVKIPPVVAKPRRIITAAQFDAIYAALDDPMMRLLVETDIESGLRWGELTELRPQDIDFSTGMLTVSRAVVHLKSKNRPDGKRFVVKPYPKDKEPRHLKLAAHLLAKLKDHIAGLELSRDDLLFKYRSSITQGRWTIPEVLSDPDTLGLTEPNSKGRQYRHGTPTAYGAGRCRCDHCKRAVTTYRASRRAAGKDRPPVGRRVDTDGHIGNDWFRTSIWLKALEKAALGFHVTPHGLRHAHASWLLAGGADLKVVKNRLGHGSIATTDRYLHTLPGSDDTALSALETIRNGYSKKESVPNSGSSALDHIEKLAKLHDSGVLTDAEFATKKLQLLERV